MSRSADDPPPLPKDRPRAGAVRSRLMLEIASEVVGRPDWTARQARVTLRSQGGSNWELTLVGSDSVLVAPEVASGEVTFAIPSHDQLGFAIADRHGITRLDELPVRRPAHQLSLHAQPDHSVHVVVAHGEDVMNKVVTAYRETSRAVAR